MSKKLLTSLAIATSLAAAAFTSASAQEARKWADVDCAQSIIVAPAGLKCRATQNYAGDAGGTRSTVGGTFQRWTAFGTVGTSKYFYFVMEGTAPSSSVYTTATLVETISGAGNLTKGASHYSELIHAEGADYATFMRPPGESCFAMRKLGPSQGAYSKWILYGGRCDPAAQAAAPADIARFIAAAAVRD